MEQNQSRNRKNAYTLCLKIRKLSLVLRCARRIIRGVVVFVQTFAERFAVFMNTIAEILAGFDSAAAIKLSYALRQSIPGFDAI